MSELPTLPHAPREEQDILAICLTGPRDMPLVAAKLGLRAEHFYRPRNGRIYEGILEVGLQKKPIDALTVAAHLEADGITFEELGRLIAESKSASLAIESRVERVIEMAERRNQHQAAQRIIAATNAGDEEEIAQALAQVQTSVRLETKAHDRFSASRDFAAHLREEAPLETFRLPWKDLERFSPGGFLRHHFISIVAWSGYGKSSLLDQMLSHWAKQGYRCGLYMTEMDGTERMARYVSAGTGIPFARLLLKTGLSDPERARAVKFIETNPLPFDPIDAEGWSATRIREHAILNGYDVIAADTVNNIPHKGREEFEHEIRTLASAAKIAGSLTIGVFQLNQQRRDGLEDPAPSLRDIRETGQVEHLSDRVMSLHRDNREGQVYDTGVIRFLKCRGGVQGGRVDVEHIPGAYTFEDKHMRKAREAAPDATLESVA